LAGRVLLPAVMVAGLVAERFGRIEREGRGGGSFDSLRMTDLWAWDERAVRASRECPTHRIGPGRDGWGTRGGSGEMHVPVAGSCPTTCFKGGGRNELRG